MDKNLKGFNLFVKHALKRTKNEIKKIEKKQGKPLTLDEKNAIAENTVKGFRGKLVGTFLIAMTAITGALPSSNTLALASTNEPKIEQTSKYISFDKKYKVDLNTVSPISNKNQEEVISDKNQINNIIEEQINFSISDYGSIYTKEDGSKIIDIELKDIPDINFELPILGAAGMANCDLNLRDSGNIGAQIITTIPGGTRFTFLEEEGDYVKVALNGDKNQVGYVYKNYCLINIPDVIRSINYSDPNNEAALFQSNGYTLDGVTGEKLGNARNYNNRINEESDEILAAFPAAKALQLMQYNCMINGYSITVVNGFRPREIQDEVKNALQSEYNNNDAVRASIDKDNWSVSWFIATGDKGSEHQYGGAFDLEAVKFNSGKIENVGGIDFFVPIEAEENGKDTPSVIHDLSSNGVITNNPVSTVTNAQNVFSIRNTGNPEEISSKINSYISSKYNEQTINSEEAMVLAKMGFASGFSELDSEWWHFNYMVTDGETVSNFRTILCDMPGAGGKFFADGISNECSISLEESIEEFGTIVNLSNYKKYFDLQYNNRFDKSNEKEQPII